MDLLGITTGFGAATLMAVSFISSGWAVRKVPGLNGLGVISNAVVLMGIYSLCMLPFFWTPSLLTALRHGWLSLAGISASYFCGQIAIFTAQKKVDSSQIVPLLGVKLPMLALLNLLIFHETFNVWQILGIALTMLAAFVLNNAGYKIPWLTMLLVFFGCMLYSLSDMCIKAFADHVLEDSTNNVFLGSIQCTLLSYIVCGIVGCCILAFRPVCRTKAAFLHTLPYSVCWLISIVFLTICFARIGTVNGNIVQATRGIIVIVVASLLICFGWMTVEQKVSTKMLFRRIIAALMMFGAIVIYNFR